MPVQHKTDQPDHQILNTERGVLRICFQDEEIRDLNGDHGGEDRPDKVQEIRNILQRQADGADGADDRYTHGNPFAVDAPMEGFAGYACGIGIQEGGGHRGEHNDHKTRNAQTSLHHDLRDVGFPGEDGRAHADDIHPAADQPINNGAGGGCLFGLLCFPGIVTDEGQPAQGHGHGKLHRRAEGHAVAADTQHGSLAEDHKAQHNGQQEQGGHGHGVELSQVLNADEDPQHNEAADDDGPDPAADAPDAVDGQGAVKDHNGGPAYQLDDVQNTEQQRALGAEAHFGGIHGAFADLAADEARQIQHDAADDMAQENGQQTLPKAQGGKVGAGEDLRDGDRRAEPDQTVFKYGGTFFFHVLRLL